MGAVARIADVGLEAAPSWSPNSSGRSIRETTGATSEREAKDFLNKREGAIADGRPMAGTFSGTPGAPRVKPVL